MALAAPDPAVADRPHFEGCFRAYLLRLQKINIRTRPKLIKKKRGLPFFGKASLSRDGVVGALRLGLECDDRTPLAQGLSLQRDQTAAFRSCR